MYDIAVIGSGFAGSLMAMIARRLGRSVILLERGTHPRVVIGESSTPLSNLLLEELATRYDLPRIKPLANYGTWLRTCPDIACGLKRGFTFYHHDLENSSPGKLDRSHQLLVSASPHDRIADTHWYRADVDAFFVEEAKRNGVEYLDQVHLTTACRSIDGFRLAGARNGVFATWDARFVIDATGPRGFLHQALSLRAMELPGLAHTQALYSHFRGVQRLENASISESDESPPYPVNDAAVHHVFEGGWVWVLQFNNGITSAGVAATAAAAARLSLLDGAPAWERLLQKIPLLQEQFSRASTAMPFTHVQRLPFRTSAIAGDSWAMLPSAAGFVDPLLSTGFPLTMMGITRIAELIEQDWGSNRFRAGLQEYSSKTDAELLATARLIGALYANMHNFPVFVSLSMLYFAAASFSETVRRLNKPHRAQGFLLHDDPSFGPACVQLLKRAKQVRGGYEADRLREDVARIIEPFNVAGLGDEKRSNWYPVEASDLIRSAPKVGATQEDIADLLERSGFRSAGARRKTGEALLPRAPVCTTE